PDQLADADSRDYAALRTDVRVVGLDVSAPALAYGRRAGLLAEAWCEDLEREEPSPALVAGLRDVGVIFSTGGVGYVGTRTFERLLRHAPDPGQLWLAIFVLRVFDYAPIAELLGDYGLVTDRLPGTFPQRQFADATERAAALRDVRRRGLDPTGRESAGWFHADCFVSRPASQAGTPLRLRG
ncbi:MAG: class I SAM-dependent methyltransferase, partial [Mycobacterium sp.]